MAENNFSGVVESLMKGDLSSMSAYSMKYVPPPPAMPAAEPVL